MLITKWLTSRATLNKGLESTPPHIYTEKIDNAEKHISLKIIIHEKEFYKFQPAARLMNVE